MFDFLCYKSIVLYINHNHEHADKIFNFNEERYWDFSKIARQSRDYDQSMQIIVEKYKDFMCEYYEMIDVDRK